MLKLFSVLCVVPEELVNGGNSPILCGSNWLCHFPHCRLCLHHSAKNGERCLRGQHADSLNAKTSSPSNTLYYLTGTNHPKRVKNNLVHHFIELRTVDSEVSRIKLNHVLHHFFNRKILIEKHGCLPDLLRGRLFFAYTVPRKPRLCLLLCFFPSLLHRLPIVPTPSRV